MPLTDTQRETVNRIIDRLVLAGFMDGFLEKIESNDRTAIDAIWGMLKADIGWSDDVAEIFRQRGGRRETAVPVPEEVCLNAEAPSGRPTQREAALRVIENSRDWMNLIQIVAALRERYPDIFHPNAQTPEITIGTQLSQYMKECAKYGTKCRIRKKKDGKTVLYAAAEDRPDRD